MTCKWNSAIHKVYAFVKPLYLFKIGNFLFQLLWYASLKAFGVAFWCHPVIFSFYIIKQTHDISNLACTHTHTLTKNKICVTVTLDERCKRRWNDKMKSQVDLSKLYFSFVNTKNQIDLWVSWCVYWLSIWHGTAGICLCQVD